MSELAKTAQAGTPEVGTSTGFGPTLKNFRERRRVSQAKLSERAGYDHSYVSRLESGAREPSPFTAEELGRVLELEAVDKTDLMMSAGFADENTRNILREPTVGEVFDLLQGDDLTDEEKEYIRRTLRLLATLGSTAVGAGQNSDDEIGVLRLIKS